jgi:transposase-like protein
MDEVCMGNRRWTEAEKRRAVERMKICGHDKLAAELGIQRRQLYAWRAQLKRLKRGVVDGRGSKKDLGDENERLKRALAEKVLEVEFFKGALRRIEARRQGSIKPGETAFTNRSK